MTLAPARPAPPQGRVFAYQSGERLSGGYVIQHGLGHSDLGDTYLAEDASGLRRVARLLAGDVDVARASLEPIQRRGHAHLVESLGLLQANTGETWAVRSYAAGRNLADVLTQRNGGMPLKETLRWAKGIAAGLQALEEAGQIHGRLKPSNVWLEQGVVKLTDYGFALAAPRLVESDLPRSPYAAPEFRGGRFDKADLYALGALLFEMLSGRAFDPTEAWRDYLADPYAAILLQALDPDPARRFGHVGELLQALEAAPARVPPPAVNLRPPELAAAPPVSRFAYGAGDRPLPGLTILRPLGLGASGEVYQAASDGGKTVALKLLQRNWEVELRGLRDCLRLARHPNLLDLHDVRQSPMGEWWVVMDYADGPSLAEALEQARGPLSPRTAAEWMRGVLAGLAHLHDAGIVHRDLKPRNILRQGGVVKIADYGLAKVMSHSRRTGHTETVGTLCYTAPEVARGRYGREVDLYACGVMLYELLTGHVPFDGESAAEVLYKHLLEPPDLNNVPKALRPVAARALAKDPRERYASAQAMAAALEQALRRPEQTGAPPTREVAARDDHLAGVALIAWLTTATLALSLMQSGFLLDAAKPQAISRRLNPLNPIVEPACQASLPTAPSASSIWRPNSGSVM